MVWGQFASTDVGFHGHVPGAPLPTTYPTPPLPHPNTTPNPNPYCVHMAQHVLFMMVTKANNAFDY